ncbi:hypothetical protein [Acaryochloris marina]|uniref:hypothetical protein n=1 Tax=Acaryochloris marina TaxID=155978 RepID=UPI001BB043D3|nr:hypothetical protein [Acaryochloris marina]QUY44162.1 hypothetical protein I1H34_08760 [Acaryochloris marina S15]
MNVFLHLRGKALQMSPQEDYKTLKETNSILLQQGNSFIILGTDHLYTVGLGVKAYSFPHDMASMTNGTF